MKKLASLIMAAVLALSLFGSSALAADDTGGNTRTIEYTYWVGDPIGSREYFLENYTVLEGAVEEMVDVAGNAHQVGDYRFKQVYTDSAGSTNTVIRIYHIVLPPQDKTPKVSFTKAEEHLQIGSDVDALNAAGKLASLHVENGPIGDGALLPYLDQSDKSRYFTDYGWGGNLTFDRIYDTTHWCLGLSVALRPGKMTVYTSTGRNNEKRQPTMDLIIDEPKIETNLPTDVKPGTQLDFSTKLTGTALTDKKVKDVQDHFAQDPFTKVGDSWLAAQSWAQMPGFAPSVEILEGSDLVTRANGDYSNTLHSRENLTFTKEGTVKLKVTYSMIFNPDFRADKDAFIPYNAEEILTVQVRADAPDILPDGTPSDHLDLPVKGDLALSEEALADVLSSSSGTVQIDLQLSDPNAALTLTSGAVTAIRQSQKTAVITAQSGDFSYSWTFEGAEMDAFEGDIRLDVSIQNQLKSHGQLLLGYRHSGSLPAGTQFSLTGDDLKDKTTFYLYKVGNDGQATLVQEGLAVSGNTLRYLLSHCSNYLLRTEKFVTGDAPQTGDHTALPLSLTVGSSAALVVFSLFCRKRRVQRI